MKRHPTTKPARGSSGPFDKALLVLFALTPAAIAGVVIGPGLAALLLLWPVIAALCAFRGPGLVRRAWERNIVEAPAWMTDEYAAHSAGGRLALVEQDGAVALVAGHPDNLVAIISRGYVRELDREERSALWARIAHEAAGGSNRRQRASTFADPIGALCRAYTPNLGWLQHGAAIVSAPWSRLVHRVIGDEVALRDGDTASVGHDREKAAVLASAYRRGVGAQMRLRSGGLALVGAGVFLGERAMRLEVIAGNRMHTHGPVHGGMDDSPISAYADFEVVDLDPGNGDSGVEEKKGHSDPAGAPPALPMAPNAAADDFSHLLGMDDDVLDGAAPVGQEVPLPIRRDESEDDTAPSLPTAAVHEFAKDAVDAQFADATDDLDVPDERPRRRWRPLWFLSRRPQHAQSSSQTDPQLDSELTPDSGEARPIAPETAPENMAANAADASDAPAPSAGEPDGPADEDECPMDPEGGGLSMPADDLLEVEPTTQAMAPEVSSDHQLEEPIDEPVPTGAPNTKPEAPAVPPKPIISPDQKIDLGIVTDLNDDPPPLILPPPAPIEWEQKVRPWTELAPKPETPEDHANRRPVSWDADGDDDQEHYRDPLGALLRRRRSRDG